MDIATLPPLVPEPATAADLRQTATPAATGADFQSFLTLLTAQMRNQDPLQPLDSTQFVAQLASFSSVEQLIGVNSRLEALAEASRGNQAGLATWIGRLAGAVDGRFLADGQPVAFDVPPVDGAVRAEAVVLAADGTELDRFDAGTGTGRSAVWDGGGAAGIPIGSALRIELAYHGQAGIIERRPATVLREITGLRGTEDGPLFELAGGGTLRPSEITELRRAGAEPARSGMSPT